MKIRCYLSFIVGFSLFTQTIAQKMRESETSLKLQKPTGEPMVTLVNVNRMTLGVQADGTLSPLKSYTVPLPNGHTRTYWWKGIYPNGTAGAIYQDGIIWGGKVLDGHWDRIRVGGSRYCSGLQLGRIISKGIAENPDDPDVRIWRIRRDWKTADLTRDVAEFLNIPENTVTQENIDSVRAQYEKDWNEWPWEKGAPFYDNNRNGIMDDGEEPGLAYADQVVWYVANDLDESKIISFAGAYPIGLEVQVTLWAYNRTSPRYVSHVNEALQNIIFKRARLIYKGRSDTPDGARIDSMYIGQWSDTDLGYYCDDLVGCDTLLDMGFVYNSKWSDEEYDRYSLPPPAVGYCLLQGPLVASESNQGLYNMGIRENFRNLTMTSFVLDMLVINWTGWDCRFYTYEVFNGMLRGDPCRYMYYPFPPGVKRNNFPFSGDPVFNTGYLDGQGEFWSPAPGNRRFMINTGPFTMALGDTQEVIIALVGGLGADCSSSISVMKYHAKVARFLAHNNFEIGFAENNKDELHPVMENVPLDFTLYPNTPNPFNAGTEIRYDLPLEKNVKLVIYNVLGQKVKVLVDETQVADNYKYRWDGTNDFGEKVPSGIYFCRLEAGHWILTRKMTLLE